MVLMPGMLITPGHLYGVGGGTVGKHRPTHPLRHKQLAEAGSASSSLNFLPENKSFGQEFESVQLKVWFGNVWHRCGTPPE